ncbi:lysophospholipid acyltransferase family protein [Halobacillus sp. B23F22_1]|uniref:lysophospholipid acyltransferase family protein n=1 Tax=Halobacillus sp. B23F22_1 TaxID=3459514 RepID=UPI00373F7A64
MLKANKSPWMMWGFTRFNRIFLHHHFNNIKICNLNSTSISKKSLFIVNHSSWWDALIIFFLNDQVVQSDAYGMMHEEGIRRFPFFRKIGVYSMNSKDRRHLLSSLSYSTELLERDKTVWMFPQGDEQHLEKRPLEFSNGASYIAERAEGVHVIPVSLYYSLEHMKKPNVYAIIGRPIDQSLYKSLSRKEKTQLFEKKVTAQLNELKKLVIQEKKEPFSIY